MFFLTDILYVIPFQMFIQAGMIFFKSKIKKDLYITATAENGWGKDIYISEERLTIFWLCYANWIFLTVMATRRELGLRRKLGTFPSAFFVITKALEERRKFDIGIDLSAACESLQLKLEKMQNPKLNRSQHPGEKSSQNQDGPGGIGKNEAKGCKSWCMKIDMTRLSRLATSYTLAFFAGVTTVCLVSTLVALFLGMDLRLYLLSWDVLPDSDRIFILVCCLVFPWSAWIFAIYAENQFQLKKIMERHQHQHKHQHQNGAYEKSNDNVNTNTNAINDEEANQEKINEDNSSEFKVSII